MPPEDNAPTAPGVSNNAPPATPPAPPNTQSQEPSWLPDRLARAAEAAEKKRLQELGVPSFEELSKIVKAAKEAADANKSLTDRYAETTSTLTNAQKQLESANAVIKARADSEFAALTPEQQNAVTAIAGDDYVGRLKAITALSPTWVKAAETAAPAKPPVAAPANSTPIAPKPPATPPPATTDDAAILSSYENLQKTNPVAAAGFMMQNFQALQRARGVS